MQKRRNWNRFLSLLINHHSHASPAIRMAAARQLAPVVLHVIHVHQVGPIAERAHEADREPVSCGFAQAGLIFYVVRQVRKGIALGLAAFVGDAFVTSGEAYWLEAQEA